MITKTAESYLLQAKNFIDNNGLLNIKLDNQGRAVVDDEYRTRFAGAIASLFEKMDANSDEIGRLNRVIADQKVFASAGESMTAAQAAWAERWSRASLMLRAPSSPIESYLGMLTMLVEYMILDKYPGKKIHQILEEADAKKNKPESVGVADGALDVGPDGSARKSRKA